jgi:hypothetical protein
MMESPISDPSSAFNPHSTASAMQRTLASAAAQMSHYSANNSQSVGNSNISQHHSHSHPHSGPYSSIFNVSSVIAEQLSVSRGATSAFGINMNTPSSASAAVMQQLQSRFPDHHHHLHHSPHYSTTAYIPERASHSAINCNNMMSSISDIGSSPTPSTDNDSIAEHLHCEENFNHNSNNNEDNKLLTFRRAIQTSSSFSSKANDCGSAFSSKEQKSNLIISENTNGVANIGKKQRHGKTVSKIIKSVISFD